MEDWPRDMFKKNGLMQRIQDSKISLEKAESQVFFYFSRCKVI